MEILIQDDAINRRAAEVADWLHSVIDIPGSPLGTTPHEESTQKIHFCIPHTLAESICKEDYYKYYEPRVVSIGPFHYGQPRLAPMENYKRTAVKELSQEAARELSQEGETGVSIEQVYASVEQDLLRIAKECYDVPRWPEISDRDWCLMMFLDGCFVIWFEKWSWWPIMKKHDRDLVRRDLLLLGNQLPFQVLEILARPFRCERFTLGNLIIRFLHTPLLMISSASGTSAFTDYIRGTSRRCPLQQRNAPVHLLQHYRDIWISVLFKEDVKEEEENNFDYDYEKVNKYKEEDHLAVRSVTELKKVGIRCSCAMDHRTFFSPKDIHLKSSIHFKSSMLSGNLFLPQLIIDEWTMTLFYNLVAYEYSCSIQNISFGISSYLSFMSMLINGEEDVTELRARGVIQLNLKGGDDQVVNFLKDIAAHREPKPQDFKDVKQEISTHLKSKHQPLRVAYAEFKQRYFSGPWSFLVFLAVIFTVSMTVIQTVLTGIQTFK